MRHDDRVDAEGTNGNGMPGDPASGGAARDDSRTAGEEAAGRGVSDDSGICDVAAGEDEVRDDGGARANGVRLKATSGGGVKDERRRRAAAVRDGARPDSMDTTTCGPARDASPPGPNEGAIARKKEPPGGEDIREAIVPVALLMVFVVAFMSAPTEKADTQQNAGQAASSQVIPAATSSSAAAPGKAAPALPLDTLRRTVELAKSASFYLVLDPAAGTLTLGHRGVTARTWHVTRIETGQRRVLWLGREKPAPVTGTSWTGGYLDPERKQERPLLEVDSQGTPQGPEPNAIPRTPEEAVPAPHRYRIRFEEGLTVEVVSEIDDGAAGAAGPTSAGAGGKAPSPGTSAGHDTSGSSGSGTSSGSFLSTIAASLTDHWRDATEATSSGAATHPRIRLVLTPADHGSLYRGFPLGAALVISGS